jgi:hypothetical protein
MTDDKKPVRPTLMAVGAIFKAGVAVFSLVRILQHGGIIGSKNCFLR